MSKWIEAPVSKNEDHLADLIFQDEEGNHWYEATVRGDGCINFFKSYDLPFNHEQWGNTNQKHINICNVGEFIKILLLLEVKAIEYFKKHNRKWPDL